MKSRFFRSFATVFAFVALSIFSPISFAMKPYILQYFAPAPESAPRSYPEVIEMFQKETGIEVIYEEYETNEVMYPKVASGAISYDVLCPSEYMCQRMLEEDFLRPIDMDSLKNKDNIGDEFWEICRSVDPDNRYFVPYSWGTIGILYNKKMVDEPVDSWSILWKEKYKGNILMQNSVRDALGITLKYLGYSLNSTDLDELTEARDMLVRQKPLVQAYVVDQVRDKMIGNEAALGVIYSGEARISQASNPDLEYVIPKEGSNIWVDGWVIPKNARNVENAQKWIDFMCRPDKDSDILFPSEEDLKDCELLHYLGKDTTDLYNKLWRDIKSK